jgi:hypothetical protein
MSYYCKGTGCSRAKKCARAESWRNFPHKENKEGFATGVWYVREKDCIQNNYGEGVFG